VTLSRFFLAAPRDAWDVACRIAAITHGHPDRIYPAGVLAVTIRLIDGQPLADAVGNAAEFAHRKSTTRQAMERAFALANEDEPTRMS
jgi:ADP-ribosylglycohydrolase